jgi:hypothetical protein
MVGEQVDEKDQRWLDRYEAKLQAQEAAAAAGTPMMVSADEMDVAPTVASEVAALSRESAPEEAQANADADADEAEINDLDLALTVALEDESLDDLEANSDWDDESEGEATT